MAGAHNPGERDIPGERVSGYLASAAVFAAITAAWAFIVRADPYYQWTDLFGFRLPISTVIYLVVMPVVGFVLGRWRYQRRHAGAAGPGFLAKLVARAVQFVYAHSLLVLFTAAMMTDYFLGLNIDDQVRSIDDGMFDLGARFAPWLSAYLAGFNLGRASGLAAVNSAANAPPDEGETISVTATAPRREREQPTFGEPPLAAGETGDFNPPARRRRRKDDKPGAGTVEAAGDEWDKGASGVATAQMPGFLPPQDLDRLRPGYTELR
ncbi:MAG: hypothetical protein R3C51_01900 [Parvularculaceae bacterium]